jgi:hypothetical protein
LTIVGMMILPAWIRKRRREATRLQADLTDALDSAVGPIVAPVVTRSLWGRWRIELALPFGSPGLAGKILAAANEALSTTHGMPPAAYRIVLAHTPDGMRTWRVPRTLRAAGLPSSDGRMHAA